MQSLTNPNIYIVSIRKEVMFSTYEDFIKKEIESFKSYGLYYDMAIQYIPYIFKLLSNIIEMNDISFETRVRINCALAYLVIENDVLPENIYGAEGYMDDLFVLVYVLKELMPKYIYLLKAQWVNIIPKELSTKDLEAVLNDCYAISLKVLKERNILGATLEFAGLKKPSAELIGI